MNKLFLSSTLILFFTATSLGSTVLVSADTLIEKWGVFELTVSDDGNYSNPFWDATITGQFSGLGGKYFSLKGFYYDSTLWKIRFSPTVVGVWHYTVTFVGTTGTKVFAGSFFCIPASPGKHGFITVNSGSHSFTFEDSTTFIPLGINGHTPAVTAAMIGIDVGSSQVASMWDTLSHYYVNTYRLMMFHQNEFPDFFSWNTDEGYANLLYNTSSLDKYNIKVGKLIDRWFTQAMERNINIYLCLFDLFDISQYPFYDSPWCNSMGGPYSSLNDLYQLTTGTGPDLVKKYIQYVTRRWGAYSNLVLWEYNNEFGPVTSTSWISMLNQEIENNDPYRRARTVSFWCSTWGNGSPVDNCKGVTVTDDHFYKFSLYDEFTGDSAANHQANYRFNTYTKPVMFGELGSGPDNTTPSDFTFQCVSYWAALTGGGYSLYWLSGDNTYNGHLYNKATLQFVKNIKKVTDRIKYFRQMRPNNDLVSVSLSNSVRVYCLSDSIEHLTYLHHYTNHTSPVSGLKVQFAFPQNYSSDYTMVWINASTGDSVYVSQGHSSGGILSINAPDFVVDLLGYLRMKNSYFGIQEIVVMKPLLIVSPNPASDKITIVTYAIPTKGQLSIMNPNGQEILTRQISEPKTMIDISKLPAGVYFVWLTNNRTMEVGKFIKQ
jgi:Domain of unknown function (DUF5060)/Secretion system C-terminal sorting domain